MTLAPSRRLPALATMIAVAAAAATVVVAAAGLGWSRPAAAAEETVVYPARVTTMQGRIHPIQNLGHEYEEGSFLYYDGEIEGRVQWRDLDRVTFIGNLGHQPGTDAPVVKGSRRATLRFRDGSERQVNLVAGRIFGHDGISERSVPPGGIAVIDFDEMSIAPKMIQSCLRGHVWENEDFKFCPYDGLHLEEIPAR